MSPGNIEQESLAPITLLLNLRGGTMLAGATVQLWDDRQNHHNHWRMHQYGENTSFTIQSVASNLFLCVPDGNQALGVRPVLQPLPAVFDLSFARQIQQYLGRDTYVIMNRATRTVLNVAGGRMEYGNKVHMSDNPQTDDSQ